MFENNHEIDLSGAASRSTLGKAASWLGWALLLGLAVVTGVHAISITQQYTGLSTATGDAFAIIRVAGVILAELFAVATAVMLATHTLRAKQKPMAMAVEITWFAFAAINLVSSFAVEHGGEMPAFVGSWVRYGLPVAALIIGVQFYVMLRLNPDAKRADDMAELRETIAHNQHQAAVEVLNSDQMKAVQRQAAWQKLPSVIGQQLNLSDAQIRALVSQAPALLDLNRNGVPDVQEAQMPDLYRIARANSFTPEEAANAIVGMRHNYHEGDRSTPPPVYTPADWVSSPNGHGPENGHGHH